MSSSAAAAVAAVAGGQGNGRPTRQASRAVSTTGRAVDSFFTGRDRALWSTAYQPGHGWSAPVSLGGTLQGQPSAVTTATGMMVFFRGAHGGRLHYVTASGGNWSAVQELPMGPLGTAPRAVSTDSGNVYVFWRGVNPHQLWSAHYAPASGWHGPTLLASGLGSQPSPAVSGAETVNVFWKGTDGQLWQMSRSLRHSWSAPSALAMGQIGAAPHATAQHNGEIDVFWGGATPGSVWHGTYSSNSRVGQPAARRRRHGRAAHRGGLHAQHGERVLEGARAASCGARPARAPAGARPPRCRWARSGPSWPRSARATAWSMCSGGGPTTTCGTPASIRRPRRGRARTISGGACADAPVAGRAAPARPAPALRTGALVRMPADVGGTGPRRGAREARGPGTPQAVV